MAHSFDLVPVSDTLSASMPGEISTFQQVGIFRSDGLGGSPADSWGVYFASEVPRPKAARLTTGTAWQKSFVCINTVVKQLPEDGKTWIVTITWATRQNYDACAMKPTRSAGARLVDRWRDGAPPAAGAATWPPTAGDEVSGTKLDVRGTPQRIAVPQQTVIVETFFDATFLRQASGVAWPNYQSINATYAFKRNSAAYLGWDAGKLLFLGCDETGVHDIWRTLTWRFLADEWFHLEQRPRLEANGKVLCADSSTWPDGSTMFHASKVAWYQPYPGTADFREMFDSCTKAQIDNPTPVYVPS